MDLDHELCTKAALRYNLPTEPPSKQTSKRLLNRTRSPHGHVRFPIDPVWMSLPGGSYGCRAAAKRLRSRLGPESGCCGGAPSEG